MNPQDQALNKITPNTNNTPLYAGKKTIIIRKQN